MVIYNQRKNGYPHLPTRLWVKKRFSCESIFMTVPLYLHEAYLFVGHEELEREAIYLQPGVPKNKPLRLLTLKGVGRVYLS